MKRAIAVVLLLSAGFAGGWVMGFRRGEVWGAARVLGRSARYVIERCTPAEPFEEKAL